MRIREIAFRFFGFALVGGGNTLLSMLLIFALNELLGADYRFSYVSAFVVTTLLAYWANARLVFRCRLSLCGVAGFFGTYLAGMALGYLLLVLLADLLPEWNRTLLTCLVIPVTTAFNFFFVNVILGKGSGRHDTRNGIHTS